MAQMVGRVVGTKMQKTAKVSITRMLLHPQLLKMVSKRKKYFAHDEQEDCRLGDLVMIKECRPLSKKKHFRVMEILERAPSYTDPETGAVHYQTKLNLKS